ncbi:hypothetical protein, partial [uncultured Planktomarina sp.]|uniref:hypothetical protein n=1 Tax=uncultured Planktomarina sp. TaxID=1538529 RepID=UPI0032B15781
PSFSRKFIVEYPLRVVRRVGQLFQIFWRICPGFAGGGLAPGVKAPPLMLHDVDHTRGYDSACLGGRIYAAV